MSSRHLNCSIPVIFAPVITNKNYYNLYIPMKRILSLLTVVLLVTSQYLYAQKSAEKLVVLPFRVVSDKVHEQGSYGKLKAYELEEGLMYQKAFYNALTADGRHISLEDVDVTNARLKAAGIDLAKACFMDKAVLCKLLKADGVISGMIHTEMADRKPAYSPINSPRVYSNNRNWKWINLQLFDSVNEDIIWEFEEGTPADKIMDSENASALNRFLAKKIYKKISHYVETL